MADAVNFSEMQILNKDELTPTLLSLIFFFLCFFAKPRLFLPIDLRVHESQGAYLPLNIHNET